MVDCLKRGAQTVSRFKEEGGRGIGSVFERGRYPNAHYVIFASKKHFKGHLIQKSSKVISFKKYN